MKLIVLPQTAMNSRMKSSLVIFFLLIMCLSAGVTKGSGVETNPLDLLHKGGVGAKSRKLLGLDAVSDYDYACPNPRHDPRGRKKCP